MSPAHCGTARRRMCGRHPNSAVPASSWRTTCSSPISASSRTSVSDRAHEVSPRPTPGPGPAPSSSQSAWATAWRFGPASCPPVRAQRVALARALATDPALLLLDEPLSALDPTTRAQTRADLGVRLRAFSGVTILVTHDPLDALSLADRLVFIEAGKLVQEGTPQEVIARPRDAYVAQVVGLNFLRGQRAGDQQVDVGGTIVVAPDIPAGGSGGSVCVTIPPSAVALYRTRTDGSPRNTWPVTVSDIQLIGQTARVILDGPFILAAEVTAGAVADLRLGVGQELWATVKATEVSVYPA